MSKIVQGPVAEDEETVGIDEVELNSEHKGSEDISEQPEREVDGIDGIDQRVKIEVQHSCRGMSMALSCRRALLLAWVLLLCCLYPPAILADAVAVQLEPLISSSKRRLILSLTIAGLCGCTLLTAILCLWAHLSWAQTQTQTQTHVAWVDGVPNEMSGF